MDQIKVKVKELFSKHYPLIGILLIGAILRLYKIGEYMTFLGDEGRDAIIVRRLLVNADPILVGPGTSIGNMYLGPLYYYFMAPWLWLSNLSPVGPAIGVAILGVITIALIYFVAHEWFGKTAAVITAILYAVAPTVIIYSRSSWNPNIMPFFATLCIYSIWKVWEERSNKWLVVLGVSFAFVLQSHYLGLLLAPILGLFWITSLIRAKKEKRVKAFLKLSFVGFGVFAFLMSPLLIFDARHGWRNFEAIKLFFTERQTTVSAKPWNAIPQMWPVLNEVISSVVGAKNTLVGGIVSTVLILPVFFFTNLTKKIKVSATAKKAYFLLFVWLGVSLIGLGLYKQEIYDHYFGFIFAAPFLILGGLAQQISNSSRIIGKSVVVVGVFILLVVNIFNSPLKFSPNRQLQRTEEVAAKIVEVSEDKPFNLAVIAERNYDDAYQYFLETWHAKMIDIDPQRTDETITDQLFVVCEMQREKCDPTHSPKAEVANFGWSKIEEEWEVSGTILFKLVHSQ